MIKFLKGAEGYIPVANIMGIDAATDANDVTVFFKADDNSAGEGTYVLDGGSAGVPAKIAEAIIEEINFGKQVFVDLAEIHKEVTAVTFDGTV
jgi:hypothetical protein